MTEMQLREKIVDIAKSLIGKNEADRSHREIIDIYNAQKILPVGYKVSYYDAWCATYITVVGILAKMSSIILPECSCPRMISLYKKAGRWVEADDFIPMPGDIVMYDRQDSKDGSGDNHGDPDHVGYVVSVGNSSMTIIEGNINNAVGYRPLEINGAYIRGYCIPDYASAAKDYKEEDDEMTYEQFEAFMDRYLQEISKKEPGSWSKNSRNWAENTGLIKGDENGNKRYKSNITREEFAEVLYRYDQMKK